jgi:G3E family GTPase
VKPHVIIIESTGLADPEPLAYRVKTAGLGLDAVITVVDAANVDRQLAETEVATSQIQAADFLVVNKLDLVDERAAAAVEKRLAKMNPRAERFPTVRGAIDSDLLFATGVATYRERARATSEHLDHDGIGSFLYRTPHPLDQERFARVLDRLPKSVLRAKGVVRFAGRDWQGLFNFTCGRHELAWVKLPNVEETQAVFIGRDIDKYAEQIRAALAACERPEDATNSQRSSDHV